MAIARPAATAPDPAGCAAAASAAAESACVLGAVRRQRVEMERSLAALEAAEAGAGAASRVDLRPAIARSQRDWLAWMQEECRLEGDVARGSAGGVLEPRRRLRLVIERTRALDRMTQSAGGAPVHPVDLEAADRRGS